MVRFLFANLYHRITPAYAGKSSLHSNAAGNDGDHPRIRGEKLAVHNAPLGRSGSPPHTRGKVRRVTIPLPDERITPAYAGKSHLTGQLQGFSKDHPRIRGEKFPHRRARRVPGGSPPHTRGKELGYPRQSCWNRITPAYAGKRLKKSRNYAVFGLPVSAIHSVCDRAQAPGSSLATPCGRIVAPEKDDQPGLQVYSQRHHPPCAGPDQADRGSG